MLIKFYSPDEGGTGAAAAAEEELFTEVGPDAGDENVESLGDVKAKNQSDTQGTPLKPDGKSDDDSAEESFTSLIKGKYKDDFQRETQRIIDKRFKEMKNLQERVKAYEAKDKETEPLFRAMGAKYGKDPADVKAIVEAAYRDDENFANQAYDKGYQNADAYRAHIEQEAELNRLREADKIRQETEKRAADQEKLLRGWLEESETFREKVPEFDFRSEWDGNDKFRYLVTSGFGVENAYMAVHAAEYAALAAKDAENKAMAQVRANIRRPTENGATSRPGLIINKSVDAMTPDEMERAVSEAKLGKRITFRN